MMVLRHILSGKQRAALILVSVILLSVGLFINLMRRMDEAPQPSAASNPQVSPVSTQDLFRGVVRVNGISIPVEIARDDVSRERGLSYRETLANDEGILFIFAVTERQMFWMKGMRFPIDMIFINGTKVVRVASNVPSPKAGEFPAIRSSEADADKVLEVNAGKAVEWGIAEGSVIEIVE